SLPAGYCKAGADHLLKPDGQYPVGKLAKEIRVMRETPIALGTSIDISTTYNV
ncbi:hypothetical protein FQN50_004081, partial [Emmonsiellopsis sp. PD_5]